MFGVEGQDMDLMANQLASNYMEHVGMNEMRDMNQYSRSSLLRPTDTQDTDEDPREADDSLLVTTL